FTIAAAQVPSQQTSFPAVINPTASRFKTTGGHVTSPSGYDIRPFSDAALTQALTYQLVPGTYNSSTGTFEMWVQCTAVNGGIIYLAYGDATITTDGSGNPFDSDFKRVYHLADGSTLSATDTTGTQNGTFVGSPTAGTGQIDGC